jgi:PPM family protein phosphatase
MTDSSKQAILQTIIACEIGPVREQNEDSVAVETGSDHGFPDKGTIMVVADGMGGLHGGEIASSIVTSDLPKRYFTSPNRNNAEALVQSISDVNQIVYRSSFVENRDRAMGTTVVAAVAVNDLLVTANVGDSRAYLFRNGNLRQLSKDHSLRRNHFSMFDTGSSNALSHVLTQAIGPLPDVTPHVNIARVLLDDLVLLCSDGLSSFVSDQEIRGILNTVPFDDGVQSLLSLVTERKGDDNVSIILSQVVSTGCFKKELVATEVAVP